MAKTPMTKISIVGKDGIEHKASVEQTHRHSEAGVSFSMKVNQLGVEWLQNKGLTRLSTTGKFKDWFCETTGMPKECIGTITPENYTTYINGQLFSTTEVKAETDGSSPQIAEPAPMIAPIVADTTKVEAPKPASTGIKNEDKIIQQLVTHLKGGKFTQDKLVGVLANKISDYKGAVRLVETAVTIVEKEQQPEPQPKPDLPDIDI